MSTLPNTLSLVILCNGFCYSGSIYPSLDRSSFDNVKGLPPGNIIPYGFVYLPRTDPNVQIYWYGFDLVAGKPVMISIRKDGIKSYLRHFDYNIYQWNLLFRIMKDYYLFVGYFSPDRRSTIVHIDDFIKIYSGSLDDYFNYVKTSCIIDDSDFTRVVTFNDRCQRKSAKK